MDNTIINDIKNAKLGIRNNPEKDLVKVLGEHSGYYIVKFFDDSTGVTYKSMELYDTFNTKKFIVEKYYSNLISENDYFGFLEKDQVTFLDLKSTKLLTFNRVYDV